MDAYRSKNAFSLDLFGVDVPAVVKAGDSTNTKPKESRLPRWLWWTVAGVAGISVLAVAIRRMLRTAAAIRSYR